MNWISSFKWRSLAISSLACCTACAEPTSPSPLTDDPLQYRVDYVVQAVAGEQSVTVTMHVAQSSALLRELTMWPDSRVSEFEADGELSVDEDAVRWRPPATGGGLSWRVSVAQRRNSEGYDAWLDANWGLFRAEDIVPRARTRTLQGALSETHLRFDLPRDWSVVTQYEGKSGRFRVDNRQRRFDQPSGWIVLGKIGVRRETIAGVKVAVAGPVGQSVRRMDMLAFLSWTLPELARVLPELPPRITVVSAGEPMWRGGLSAPESLYVHADRPLLSENATSTLLHEIMHLTLDLSAADGFDWIIEGLAEYYSLEIMNRSGTISDARLATARADLAEWASEATTLCKRASKGATTARAVGIFVALDDEVRSGTGGTASLDDVVRQLRTGADAVDADGLAAIAESLLGHKSDTLHIDNLPGCRTISTGN